MPPSTSLLSKLRSGAPSLILRRPEILLLAMAALLWGWTYGRWDLQGADEARYVQIGKELVARGGNPFLLTVAGEPYDQKPPLPFWIFAAMYRLAGDIVTPWTARLPSILLATLSAFLIASMARRRFGPRAGLIAGVLFMTSPLAMNQAPTARLDMLFTGWLTLCLWAWTTRDESATKLSPGRALLFWGALAASFFTKGPLALIVALGVPLWESRRDRSWAPWRATRPAIGLTAALLLIGGWLVAQAAAVNGGFVWGQIWGQTYERVADGSHKNPFWYYAKSMIGGVFMPWTLFLPWVIRQAWRERKNPDSRPAAPFWGWLIVPLILLHLSTGKRQQYLLPLIPPLAVLTAVWLDRSFWNRAVAPWVSRSIGAVVGLLGAVLIGLATAIQLRGPLFWEHNVYPAESAVIIFIVCGLALALPAFAAFRARRGGQIVAVIAALMLTLGAADLGGVEPALQARNSTRALSRILADMVDAADPRVGGIEDAGEPIYHVYGAYRVVRVNVKNEKPPIADWPAVLLAEKNDADKRQEKLKAAGYDRVFEMIADGDPVSIFRRAPVAPPVSPDHLKFALAGDTGTGEEHAREIGAEIAKLHDREGLAGLFLLGDNIYGHDLFEVGFKTRFLDTFEPVIMRNVPIYGVLGNHDYAPTAFEQINSPLLNMKGHEYYSVKFGDLAQFFIISSETLDADPIQLQWLRAEMENSAAHWRILLLHEPLDASKIGHGPAKRLAELLKPIITGPHGAHLVFAGHNHIYERRVPLDGGTHITLGSGANALQEQKFPPDPRRAIGYNERPAFGWIDVTREGIVMRVVNDKGAVVDHAAVCPVASE